MANLDPVSILGPLGSIARRLPRYEHRPEQLAMAEAVARAIEKPGHLVVEAGTGVGKSFAYLVPAIQATATPKTKVVVSTHTIALQEQIVSKDIPFLQSVMPEEFTAVLVKGRSNYVSLRRLEVAIKRQNLLFQREEEIDQLVTLRMWSRRTADGSRADLDFRPLPGVWDAVQSEDDNCLGRQCPHHGECFFFKARRRMRTANVLVVNHALLVTDLVLRGEGFGLLPEYQVAVIDEAHTLEGVAGERMGVQLSNVGVDLAMARLYNGRTGKGVLASHRDACAEAIRQAQKTRDAAEDFSIKGSDASDGHGHAWTLGSSPGSDTYQHQYTDFATSQSAAPGNYNNLTTSATAASGESKSVPIGGYRYFSLNLWTPTSSTETEYQYSFPVTVSAAWS